MPCDTCPQAATCPDDLKEAVAEVGTLYHAGRIDLETATDLIVIAHMLLAPEVNASVN